MVAGVVVMPVVEAVIDTEQYIIIVIIMANLVERRLVCNLAIMVVVVHASQNAHLLAMDLERIVFGNVAHQVVIQKMELFQDIISVNQKIKYMSVKKLMCFLSEKGCNKGNIFPHIFSLQKNKNIVE